MQEIFTQCAPMVERRRKPRLLPTIGEEIARLLAPLL
jgi:hypothetical protein